jgi:hypothetical protein
MQVNTPFIPLVDPQAIRIELAIANAIHGHVVQSHADGGRRAFATTTGTAAAIIRECAVRDMDPVVGDAFDEHVIQRQLHNAGLILAHVDKDAFASHFAVLIAPIEDAELTRPLKIQIADREIGTIGHHQQIHIV